MAVKHVVIIDDDASFRQSLCWLLEGSGHEVHDFADPQDALASLEAMDPELPCCLLLDIRMPVMSGLEFHDLLLQRCIDLPVIYLSGHADVPLAVGAMRKGAFMFLEKPLQESALRSSLEQALAPTVQARRHSSHQRLRNRDVQNTIEHFSKREREVLDGVLNHMSNREIASTCCISIKTVEFHRAKIMRRLDARNATHLQELVLQCTAD